MQKHELKLVSVIIPSLHRPDLTHQCIRSVCAQTVAPDSFEILVVENEAEAGTSIADSLPDNARVIELARNYGTTGSINRACAQSSSKYLLLLNNDVQLEPGFLSQLLSVLEQNDSCAFATGKLLSARKKDRLDGAGDALLAGGGGYRLGHNDIDKGEYDQPRQVIAGCGAATLVRRSAFDEVGGLDEDFFAYVDDIDLGLRIHLSGYSGVYVPQALGFHLGSATLGGSALHPKIVEWVSRNQVLLVIKDYPASVFIRLSPRILVFQMLWFAFVVSRGRGAPYVKGILGAIRLIPRMLRKRHGIMQKRRIANAEFLSTLIASEEQVHEWYKSQPPSQQSTLLKVYFSVFRTTRASRNRAPVNKIFS